MIIKIYLMIFCECKYQYANPTLPPFIFLVKVVSSDKVIINIDFGQQTLVRTGCKEISHPSTEYV